MGISLGYNQYGKAEVRMVHVDRSGPRHRIQDVNVTSQLIGDFSATHLTGDNSAVIATDTQKNTVYALARLGGVGAIEDFALRMARHFVDGFEQVTGSRQEIEESTWERIVTSEAGEHDHAFSRGSGEVRTTVVTKNGADETVISGLTGLVVLKSTGSEFHGFPDVPYTSLVETDDRILATAVSARWRYLGVDVEWDKTFTAVRQILLDKFALTHSLSLQQTLYAMGSAALEAHPEIAEIRFSMPNKHHFLVDLSKWGLDNPNEVWYAADRPYGLIEASVVQDDAPPAPGAWEGIKGVRLMATTEKSTVAPEDERVGYGTAAFYGLQHILAMYAGVVSPPIIIGSAAGLSPVEQATLVTAALFVSGLGTLLQSLGLPYVGAKLPLVQGVSFAAVGTMTAVATDAAIGPPAARLATIFGAVIVAGLIGFVIAPVFASLVRFFPPIVTGCVITIIGLSLFPVALRWIRGNPTIRNAAGATIPNPNFGSATSLLLGVLTLVATLVIARYGRGVWSRLAVMLGLVFGTLVATVMGRVNWGAVGTGPIFQLPQPFLFGWPIFSVGVIVSMTIVILVIMAETTADILAVGEILGTSTDQKRIAAGLRADMGATAIAPVFNGFPISAFAQNVGMVAMTGVRSRFVVAAGGGILVLLGLLPVLGRVMNAIPLPVLGGAGIVLFGSVAAAGIRTLSKVEFTNSNILIVAASIGVGMIPITVPEIYNELPDWLHKIFESGISACAIVAVLLNLAFNHFTKTEEDAAPEH